RLHAHDAGNLLARLAVDDELQDLALAWTEPIERSRLWIFFHRAGCKAVCVTKCVRAPISDGAPPRSNLRAALSKVKPFFDFCPPGDNLLDAAKTGVEQEETAPPAPGEGQAGRTRAKLARTAPQ